MISRRRWLGGWGLLAGTYLALAALRVLVGGDVDGATVYVVAAVVTFGFAAAVIPFVVPRRPPDDDPPDDGPGGGGGEPEPPPWWPDFELGFRRHVRQSPASAGRRERMPA